MSAAGPDAPDAPAVTDAPFRGSVDPLGARLQQLVIAAPQRRLTLRGPFIVGAAVVSAFNAVAGHALIAMQFGAFGVVGAMEWRDHRRARPGTTTIAVHERGLRLGVDLPWADVGHVAVDTTPDQGDAPTQLTIVTPDATAVIVGAAAAIGPLVAAIAAAVGPRHHREAAARLAAGQPYSFGRHAFTEDGLRIKGALVPWRDLGPIRARRGKLVCATPRGDVKAPIAGAPNPWMLERLVAERGRAA